MPGYKVNARKFLFKYNENEFDGVETFSWAPRKADRSPGIHVMIHGNPAQEFVQIGAPVGRVGSTDIILLENMLGIDNYTGIHGKKQYIFPTCVETGLYGDSYSVTSPESGIGIYTFTGYKPNGLPAFMQPKQVYSTNPNTQGFYIGFPCKQGRFKAFAGQDRVLDVRAGQAIEHLIVPDECQIQQKMSFSLYNLYGRTKIEYSVNILLAGKNADKQHATVWVDRDQGGATVVGGVLGDPNHKTLAKGRDIMPDFTAWTSKANPSQSDKFSMRAFRLEVTWENFLDVLSMASAMSDMGIEEKFGRNWADPESWELHSVNYAQEVHNPDYKKYTASAGGRLKYFQLKAT